MSSFQPCCDEAVGERLLVLLQLLVDDRVGGADERGGVLAARQQRDRELGRNEEAHLLAVDAARDVDADDMALVVERRPAAHAGRERAAEEDLRIEAALDQAVVGALGDREADVERVAERVDPLALRERRVERAKRQRVEGLASAASGARLRIAGAQQRQVVQHVELQDLHRRLAAVGRHVDEVVPLRLERRLADDMEVGEDVALALTKKPEPTEVWLARPFSTVRIWTSCERACS